MNNKGFTLIELLAVMVILISISLVAVVGISNSLGRRDIKECQEQQQLAIGAAKIYFSMEKTNTVEVSKLVGEYLDKKYVDSSAGGRLKETDIITLVDSKYQYNGTNCEVE